jgi:hypothetical protein
MVWYCSDVTKAAVLVLSDFEPWVGSPETIIVSSSVAGWYTGRARESITGAQCLTCFLHDLLGLAPYSRVLTQKLIVSQLIKKLTIFYGTLRFITVFTRARRVPIA